MNERSIEPKTLSLCSHFMTFTPFNLKGHTKTTVTETSPSLLPEELSLKTERDNHEDESKIIFLLSPSAVHFYFLFTVRVPHKKTINLLFTDHQEIVSRRGLFTTHVALTLGVWLSLDEWSAPLFTIASRVKMMIK